MSEGCDEIGCEFCHLIDKKVDELRDTRLNLEVKRIMLENEVDLYVKKTNEVREKYKQFIRDFRVLAGINPDISDDEPVDLSVD